jgi:hypothetical protein
MSREQALSNTRSGHFPSNWRVHKKVAEQLPMSLSFHLAMGDSLTNEPKDSYLWKEQGFKCFRSKTCSGQSKNIGSESVVSRQ